MRKLAELFISSFQRVGASRTRQRL